MTSGIVALHGSSGTMHKSEIITHYSSSPNSRAIDIYDVIRKVIREVSHEVIMR